MNLKINLICSLFLTLSLSSSYGMENNNEKQDLKQSPDELNRQDENAAPHNKQKLADSSAEASNLPIVQNAHEKGPWVSTNPWILLKKQIEDLKMQGFNSDILDTLDLIRQGKLALAKEKVDYLAQQGEPIMRFLQNIPSLFKSRNTPDMTIRENISGDLSDLPEKIIKEIFTWLEPQDKAALSCVNKDWNTFIRPHFIKPPVSYDSWRTINAHNPRSFNFTPEWNKHYQLDTNDFQPLLDDSNPYQSIVYKLLFLKKNIFSLYIRMGRYIEFPDIVRLLNKYTMFSAVELDNILDNTKDVSVFLNFLKTNKTLTSLVLFNYKMDNKSAQALGEALKENKTLTSLGLYYSWLPQDYSWLPQGAVGFFPIDPYDIISILKTPVPQATEYITLTSLGLYHSRLPIASHVNILKAPVAQALREALKENKTLTSLKLHGDNGTSVPQALGETLKVNTTLTILELCGNQIDDNMVKTLGEALKVNTTLTILNLRSNQIRTAGGKTLGEALKVNTTLKSLSIEDNLLGPDGAKSLGEGLKENRGLTYLNLYYNVIENPGAYALGEALKVNTTLISLNVGKNSIGNAGAQAIMEALKKNITLTALELSRNFIGPDMQKILQENLRDHPSLKTFYL